MRDTLNRRFDVVLAASLDRFSRDQEDTAGLFKRLTFAGVNIVTLAEGDITHLHIGFKGTMNALFLKDLAEKTHRGLRGRVESGKAGGGLWYGYRGVRSLAGGTVTAGERAIEPREAAIVERIFREYVAGIAPKAIAKRLNPFPCLHASAQNSDPEHPISAITTSGRIVSSAAIASLAKSTTTTFAPRPSSVSDSVTSFQTPSPQPKHFLRVTSYRLKQVFQAARAAS
jgi:hypothetical protein